jgi:hypothetical protein
MTLATPQALIERASTQTGLSDFGAEGWREGLERLVAAMAEQPLAPAAVARVETQILNTLTARLRIEDWIARHPEAAQGVIEGPVVIIGLPRTATTAMHAMLSNDPQWRFLRGWEATEPVPPPQSATEADDPRVIKECDRLAASNPLLAKHIAEPGGPVDDLALLRLDFHNQELGWPARAYTRWWRDCDMSTAYAYHARVLKLLQSRRPPNRWLVKAPWHNFNLDPLVGVYPDARFIMCHRDPAKLIASAASLIRSSYGSMLADEQIDAAALGAFVFEHLRISIARVMDFRRRHGDDRFIDVNHEQFNADPFTTVGTIYGKLGMELSPAAREAMSAWHERNRKGVHGEHRYTPEDFGLTAGQIREGFADYIERFGVGPALSAA